jgi:hypothetical protein
MVSQFILVRVSLPTFVTWTSKVRNVPRSISYLSPQDLSRGLVLVESHGDKGDSYCNIQETHGKKQRSCRWGDIRRSSAYWKSFSQMFRPINYHLAFYLLCFGPPMETLRNKRYQKGDQMFFSNCATHCYAINVFSVILNIVQNFWMVKYDRAPQCSLYLPNDFGENSRFTTVGRGSPSHSWCAGSS